MDFIIFDLEWNTNFPGSGADPEAAARIQAEITEIGAFRLHADGRLGDSFFAQIKPQVYPRLNPWVKHITGQKFEQLKAEGLPFAEAARGFLQWALEGPAVFCSWSDSDLKPLRRNLAFYGLPTRLPRYCLDVQYLFYLLAGGERQCALAAAVEKCGIEVDAATDFHSAGGDAHYTALILKKILANLAAESGGRIPMDLLLKRYSWNPNLNYLARKTIPFGHPAEELPQLLQTVPISCPACSKNLQPVKNSSAPVLVSAGQQYPFVGPQKEPAAAIDRLEACRQVGKPAAVNKGSEILKEQKKLKTPGDAEASTADSDAKTWSQLPPMVGGWQRKKKHYVAQAVCPDHGRVTGRASFGLVAGRIPELQLRFQLAKYGD